MNPVFAIRAVVVLNHTDDRYQNALTYGEGYSFNSLGEIVTNGPLAPDEYLRITYEEIPHVITEEVAG